VTSSNSERIAADLSKIVRGDVFADILHRAAYSTDASIYQIVPLCVVSPRDADDVVTVVKYAAANRIPVVARGAGSGLAGEALSSGIVFDMMRYMNRIISISEDGGAAVCEPGVVLDDLNNCLAGYGRKIGPDPSSSNRATIGGIVANNSTGAHSLQYGHIADYVESVEAVLADGSVVEFGNDFEPTGSNDGKAVFVAQKCISILSGKEAVIEKVMPRTKRNRSGYTIAGICHEGKIDLAKLMAGSEGTLAIFTRIALRTVAVPAAKGLLELEFDSLTKMAKAVPIIVDSGAVTCELMDRNVINMAIESFPQYRDILPCDAAAVLLVEHTGQSQEQVEEKIKKTDFAVGAMAGGRRIFFDADEQKRLWKSRKDAVPLLFRKKSRKRPVEFIEDTSVDNAKLAEYLSGLEKIKKKYDISLSFYGHAGDGELHVRPNLDLAEQTDLEKMQSIANEVFELVWSLGGSISGEHADGLLRAAFIRRQYGNEVYELLQGIKNVFDPDGLMNPGKIINSDPDIMVKNLRAEHRLRPERLKTDLLFEKNELELELEQCSGCGLCLSRESDLRMCPVFRAMGDELGSSRARANILRFWATGELKDEDFASEQFRDFLSTCINCKACLMQCPSGVDVSKLVIAARAELAKRKGLKPAQLILSRNRYIGILSSLFSPVSNFVMGLGITKWFLEKLAALDSRRNMPKFGWGSFLTKGRRYLAAQKPLEKPIDKVVYFVDTYANFNDHELGFAVIKVLRHNNIEVILPKQRPAPLPAIVYGDTKLSRKDLQYSVTGLAGAVRDGYKIVCSEPSAALCLRQELRHFVSGEDAKLVSENTFELMSYLLDLYKHGKLKPCQTTSRESPVTSREYFYHTPCHLSACGGEGASIELLNKLCGIEARDLKGGCCGLAGTFGMQKKNYDLSLEISKGLREAIRRTQAKIILTECAACGMQIEHISRVKAVHPIKVLAQRYQIKALNY
jgi:FAD/FMN-containing dehydrogenase/Fe-S oxidoreductase